MHCHICDRQMSDAEIVMNAESKEWEPCGICLDIALDAAYSGGFSPDYERLTEAPAEVETLEQDVFSSEEPAYGRRAYDPAVGEAVGYFDE